MKSGKSADFSVIAGVPASLYRLSILESVQPQRRGGNIKQVALPSDEPCRGMGVQGRRGGVGANVFLPDDGITDVPPPIEA